MIQLIFPKKTRHQVKLKYKKEEWQHPLPLSDVVNNHAKGEFFCYSSMLFLVSIYSLSSPEMILRMCFMIFFLYFIVAKNISSEWFIVLYLLLDEGIKVY